MVKRKKKATQPTSRGFGAKNLHTELKRAESNLFKENYASAIQVLLPLSEQHPEEKSVWEYLAEASFEVRNFQLYQKACEGLFNLDPSAEHAYMLGGICVNNKHPLLALQALRHALALDPNHGMAEKANAIIETLEPMMENVLTEMGLADREDGMEIAVLHERGQAALERGDYAASRDAGNAVLEQYPNFVSTKNNLSLVSWMEGDIEQAVTIAQSVLEQEPDNIHALSNLVRFLVVSGDEDAAKPYGDRLKASHAGAWDGWTKKLEGLSYLRDDAGIVDVSEQAKANNVEESPAGAFFYHLAAVAMARTGDRKGAIAQWKTALKRDPNYQIAQENLDDIRLPIGQRHGAWPFQWDQWLNPQVSQELIQVVQKNLVPANLKQSGQKSPKANTIASELTRFLDNHSDVIAKLPGILERGGPAGQQFVLILAEKLKTPKLLNLIKEFALGQNGSDQLRNRAATLAAEAKLLPRDGVRLWMGGEWCEIMLLGYEFHAEPMSKHSKTVTKLLEKAISLLQQNAAPAAAEAESILNKTLEKEPDEPNLLNNLALAYRIQGREDESNALIRDIASRHPDYVFASASLAKLQVQEGDIEAAYETLRPFLSRDRFHIMEFSAFSDAYLDMLVARKQKDGARGWLQMWDQVCNQFEYDDPRFDRWDARLNSGLEASFRNFLRGK